jgi:hypothetical protein
VAARGVARHPVADWYRHLRVQPDASDPICSRTLLAHAATAYGLECRRRFEGHRLSVVVIFFSLCLRISSLSPNSHTYPSLFAEPVLQFTVLSQGKLHAGLRRIIVGATNISSAVYADTRKGHTCTRFKCQSCSWPRLRACNGVGKLAISFDLFLILGEICVSSYPLF